MNETQKAEAEFKRLEDDALAAIAKVLDYTRSSGLLLGMKKPNEGSFVLAGDCESIRSFVKRLPNENSHD